MDQESEPRRHREERDGRRKREGLGFGYAEDVHPGEQQCDQSQDEQPRVQAAVPQRRGRKEYNDRGGCRHGNDEPFWCYGFYDDVVQHPGDSDDVACADRDDAECDHRTEAEGKGPNAEREGSLVVGMDSQEKNIPAL